MFPLVKLLFTLAMSKRGRKALGTLFVYLNSKEGRKLLAQVRRVATGPQAQVAARHLATVLKVAGERARAARRPQAPPRRATVVPGRLAGFAAGARRAGTSAADRARSARPRR
jgi:hypothetical protein